MSMSWACILLPQLALDAVLRRRPDPEVPLALVEGPAHCRTLHAVNAAAAAAGVRAGMRLVAAHALLPGLALVDHQTQDLVQVQRFLAEWAYRHSSQVSMQWPGCLVMEVGASFSLLGPWPQLQARLRAELVALGFSHRLALAPTPTAARVLAGLRDGLAVEETAALRAMLDRVPVRRALLPGDAGERLQRMGIDQLQALRGLPADGLRRRFGAELATYLARLYGTLDDPLTYYAPPDRFEARIELDMEVESHVPLLFPLRRMIGDLCTTLSIRDGGVQRFVLHLEHHVGHAVVEVGMLAPERDPGLLFELARSRLEHVQLKRPVLALSLRADELPAFVPAARDLFDLRAQQALPWPALRERLRARLGDEAVYRVEPTCDPRPERAWRRACAGTAEPAPPRPPRPLWLLPRPMPLRDWQPVILAGPERLESGWWDGAEARRDYYIVQTSQGQHAWVFAPPGEQGRWMVHGWFA
jgi:protein ImuB